jgi:hypothetical protein
MGMPGRCAHRLFAGTTLVAALMTAVPAGPAGAVAADEGAADLSAADSSAVAGPVGLPGGATRGRGAEARGRPAVSIGGRSVAVRDRIRPGRRWTNRRREEAPRIGR